MSLQRPVSFTLTAAETTLKEEMKSHKASSQSHSETWDTCTRANENAEENRQLVNKLIVQEIALMKCCNFKSIYPTNASFLHEQART